MIIRQVEYAGTVAAVGQEPPGLLPQVAFSGRSNVGKSSLINTVLGRTRSRIAHVSSTPGKTQALNYYRVNDAFFLVDLPGYGYARVPKAVQESWQTLIEWYLGASGRVSGVVHLVDARMAPTPHDLRMMTYLADLKIPTLIVLTKVDKVKRGERARAIQGATAALAVDPDQIIPFSARTGEGREALLAALDSLLHGHLPAPAPGPGEGSGGSRETEGKA